MKNRILLFALTFIFIFTLIPAGIVSANNDEISVTVNGERVDFIDQGPAIIEGRTLVPVRGVFEALGFAVGWESATSTAVITNDNYELRITIGSNVFTTNGAPHTLDVPAQNIGGSTMVPIRLPLESVGVDVDWNAATQTVILIQAVAVAERTFTERQLLPGEGYNRHSFVGTGSVTVAGRQRSGAVYSSGTMIGAGHRAGISFNLNGEYDVFAFTIGPVDDNRARGEFSEIRIYLDGQLWLDWSFWRHDAPGTSFLEVTDVQIMRIEFRRRNTAPSLAIFDMALRQYN